MNRRNTENLVENLLGDFEYEVQVPYLLYRNAAQEVNGIWFYNARECEEVANLFNRILNAYAKVPPKSKVSSTKSEFEELEAVPTLAVMDGPLEPSALNVSNVADAVDDPSFVNFFSQAMAIGNTANAPITGQLYQSSATISSSSVPSHAAAPTVPSLQAPSISASTPLLPQHDAPESNNSNKRAANLGQVQRVTCRTFISHITWHLEEVGLQLVTLWHWHWRRCKIGAFRGTLHCLVQMIGFKLAWLSLVFHLLRRMDFISSI